MPRPVLMFVALLLIASSCSGNETLPRENPVMGQIVDVQGEEMELEFARGERARFLIADESVTREHLLEHMDKRWPVRVTFETDNDKVKAIRIEDAP